MATARDVAKLAGTSNAVVSYVFNDGPRGVAPATRERVLAAAAALNYRPNVLARALSAGRSRSIGLIVPDICNPYFAEIARAIADAAWATGNLLLIADAALSPDQEKRQGQSFIERHVDSLVLVSVQVDPDFSDYEAAGIPVVTLHPVADDCPASSLTINYREASAVAVRHLVEHSYPSIALLNGPASVGSDQHRDGFADAIAGTGVRTMEWTSAYSRHDAAAVARSHLAAADRPRAVYCSTDEQAFGVLYAAHEAGLRVPDDLAIVGFDGTLNCRVSIPALTSVKQPIPRMAQRAVEILHGRNANDPPIREILQYEFEARDSCGPHRQVGATARSAAPHGAR